NPCCNLTTICFRARVKSGLRLLGADASTDQWNVSVELNPKHTVATATAIRRENNADQQQTPQASVNGRGDSEN
ncbi:hypothetical protein L9F63_016323, partial [Diploptera punctata]